METTSPYEGGGEEGILLWLPSRFSLTSFISRLTTSVGCLVTPPPSEKEATFLEISVLEARGLVVGAQGLLSLHQFHFHPQQVPSEINPTIVLASKSLISLATSLPSKKKVVILVVQPNRTE